jgi:hypothetical protein
MRYVEVTPFAVRLTPEQIAAATRTLSRTDEERK